eukprot:scaffold707_cov399-Prasinococcus_capsulatus_cf.AAC.28
MRRALCGRQLRPVQTGSPFARTCRTRLHGNVSPPARSRSASEPARLCDQRNWSSECARILVEGPFSGLRGLRTVPGSQWHSAFGR